MTTIAILIATILLNLLQAPDPGPRHQLVLRLRYPDGRPVVGVEVSLLKLPDRTPVGWQNTAGACQSDAQGICTWQLFGGLYEFVFPEGLAPDPITLAELGEGGLENLAVFLDRDYTMGIVLADPQTEAAGDSLFFDRAPDEPVPQFFVPGPEDARPHHLVPTIVSDVAVAAFGPATPEPGAADAPPAIEEGGVSEGGWFVSLWLLTGLTGLAIAAFFIYRHFSQIHGVASTLHQVGDPEDKGDGPWA